TERSSRAPGEERPICTVTSTATGTVQFHGTVVGEGHDFVMDEREAGGGTDAGPAPMRYYAAGIMGSNQVWIVKVAALHDLSLDRLEGEFALYGSKADYTLSIDSPNSDQQVRDLVDEVAKVRGNLSVMAGGRPINFTLKHNGQTIMEKVYTAKDSH
ncbi:MAG TPA: hypothetical protein VGK54_03010, partial [Chloroflexota bacterium]